ncbi:SPOR domain-containing protein [Legionella pneumophila]|uniref:Sporulation domain-containing protein n=1 Tax=Legionella pneumophila subsp. pascullei TaxID=91890 RepID=A0AAX2IWE6_LEGPN|nr:SPOR domain-containing protein [Legionella pneumophila]AMP90007.1 SPOR domain-containing protein [Legionella pneumophila subsp. pascullei]AMP92326.1 sporulation protein [Legionella pneumophila subsp. pascullei]AMP95292.1 sporulation protein [Legionella pneumophila subsp. pascullei]SQG90188.1 Sporulation domain-containing protein [Legionella pneumophila subsp. pascullei]VEH06213.1 Sporulation domain-containing protein [Legionella pneumophila subsp. pascullei]
MKLIMDEKVKHRLVGLAVIISLGAIFAPALIKKSNQNPESNFSVNVKLPPKPLPPDVVITDEKEVFKTIKVAKAEIPPIPVEKQSKSLVKAESITTEEDDLSRTSKIAKLEAERENSIKSEPIKLAVNKAANATAKKVITLAAAKPPVKVSPVVTAKVNTNKKGGQVVAASKPVLKRDIYAVQLASFTQIANAQALVNRLRSKGYKANYLKSNSRSGVVYKVVVGHSPVKKDIIKLKTQLASAMQLNGFVVNTGVS